MEKRMKKALIIILSLMTCALFGDKISDHISDNDKIAAQYEKKLADLKKKFRAAHEKIKNEAIKKYEKELKYKTKTGKLDEAVEIQNKINRLKDEEEISLSDSEDDENGKKEGNSYSDINNKSRIIKRYREFHKDLVDDDIDDAYKMIDPKMRHAASEEILKAHLKLLAAFIKSTKLASRDIKVQEITFDKDKENAKVIGKYRIGMTWHPGKEKDAQYWTLHKGEWYLGDKDSLKKKFYK
jgi:hypothetical protein